MRLFFESLPIRKKLTLLMFITSVLILGGMSVFLFINEVYFFRQDMLGELSTIARMTGMNTASAIVFHDRVYAEKVLDSLSAEPNINASAIYTDKGELFAEYHTIQKSEKFSDRKLHSLMQQEYKGILEGIPFYDENFDVFESIRFDGEELGTVYIRSGMDRLFQRLAVYLPVTLSLLFFSCCLAWFLSSRLQKVFTGPILELADMMKTVSAGKDYSVRATHAPRDETGILFTGFNEMLAQIQSRDEELENHREHLEEMVNIRTAELAESNTALRQSVEELKKARNEAQAANIAKSRFLTNMSHEFRTPLNAMLGMSEVLMKTELTGEQRKISETVIQSGKHLLRLMNDVFDFSQMETGTLSFAEKDFSLRELLRDIISDFREMAERKGLKADFSISENLPDSVHGDPERLRQILANIFSNAVKFTKKGKISLSATVPDEHQPETVFFFIQDSGIGISGDMQALIFQPFTQADDSLTRNYQGTGMGLTICRHLIEMMDGEISVQSRPGEGSRFCFSVRLKPAKHPYAVHAAAPESRDSCESALFPLHVLVAEDNPVNLFVTQKMLESMVCSLDTVVNGEEAVEMLSRFSYDMVFMDCQMPVMDGYTATEEIRKSENQISPPRHTLIVALTAHSMPGERERCLASGMDDYLSKPLQPEDLENMLAKWFPVTKNEVVSPERKRKAGFSPSEKSVPAEKGDMQAQEEISGGSPEDIPPVDDDRLDNIRALQQEGKPDILKKVIGYYLEHTPGLLEELEKAVNEGCAETISETAHSLKSSSGNVGAMPLSDLCREMESIGKKGISGDTMEEADTLMTAIRKEFARVKDFFEKLPAS